MFIYLIVNHVTGKYYVGQHKGTDLKKYLQKKFWAAKHQLYGSSHLFNSIRKYGREVFTIHALLSDVQTRPELDAYERDFIAFLKSQDPEFGYNIARGGEGGGMLGKKHSVKTIEKIRASNQGKHRETLASPEMQAARLAAWQLVLDEKGGSFQTLESIEKIEAARTKQDESYRLARWKEKEEKDGAEYHKRAGLTHRGKKHSMSTEGSTKLSENFALIAHNRWHINRGITNPTCVLCSRECL